MENDYIPYIAYIKMLGKYVNTFFFILELANIAFAQKINRTSHARYSIPVFFDPHTDTVIDPVDLGVSTDNSLFEPVCTGEYIMGRNKKSFAQYKK